MRFTVCLIVALLIAGCSSSTHPNALPTSIAAPAAVLQSSLYATLTTSWQTDDGRTIQLAELHDHPVVMAMFFASCEGSCLVTIDHLREMEASLPASLRKKTKFVLATFDPAHDTAHALSLYRSDRKLSSDRWILLRGTPTGTAQLASALSIRYSIDPARGILHSNQITVLDETGRIVQQGAGNHPDLNALQTAVDHSASCPLCASH